MALKRVLAFDFGASSGRAMAGSFDGEKIALEEIHRFSNDPVYLGGTLYWDTLRQLFEIKQGILKFYAQGAPASIGIDTWGVDFGLLDAGGRLLESAVHYRDTRTAGMIGEAAKRVPKGEIYGETGIQFMEYNTLFQLLALKKQRPELLERAQTLLLTPDLFNYFLTGEKVTEYTIASTTQMLGAQSRTWARGMLDRFGLPGGILTPVTAPGTRIGSLSAELCGELGVKPAPVIAVASHDTASAVAAVPAVEGEFAYISSGTWSLLGTETAEPVVSEKSLAYNFTNEGGFGGTIRFLKNIAGLWLIQETRRQFRRQGREYSFAQLEQEAGQAEAFRSLIDPDDPAYATPGDIPSRMRAFCQKTGQPLPETAGQIIRCIYESLALKYRLSLGRLEETTDRRFSAIHVIGGGTKDGFLNALTADACGRDVLAGPVEATVLGNIAVQLIASGELGGLAEARRVIADSFELKQYAPHSTQVWDDAAGRFEKMLEREDF